MVNFISTEELTSWSTPEIKIHILALVKNRHVESLNAKVDFYKKQLAGYFSELSKRNPFPKISEQLSIVMGVWTPIWSTIPFQDILPGRIDEQSYQIFHDNGYYANIARYAPGQESAFWRKFASRLPAYDLMVLQKYAIQNEQWYIQNIGIFQAFKNREEPLTIDYADEWFATIVASKFQDTSPKIELQQEINLDKMDRGTVKKFEKAYLATPTLEHLYIDNDFRLVKSQREATQRPSYTIAIRIR